MFSGLLLFAASFSSIYAHIEGQSLTKKRGLGDASHLFNKGRNRLTFQYVVHFVFGQISID